MSPRATYTTSREFRPFRWFGTAALACLIAFFAGVIAAGAQAPGERPPSSTQCAR